MHKSAPIITWIALASLLAAGACGDDDDTTIDGGTTVDAPRPDADPDAPDADLTIPDADLTAPDAGIDAAPQPACDPVEGVPELALETLTDGLEVPVVAVVPPGESRIFFAERGGVISILDGKNVLEEPFLSIPELIAGSPAGDSERGLLGLAFHPDFPTDNRFFVFYTGKATSNGELTVAEYHTDTADKADKASAKVLLKIPHGATNHNGGWLAFGPDDGYLYVSTGDGGGGGDPDENGQKLTSLLGKLLRLDVSTPGTYSVPSTNPFASGAGGAKGEIWAYGLRNPWRNSFDRQTGDLYIGDVGQNLMEEVNVQPADSTGGLNYGWNIMEGTECFNVDGDWELPAANCDRDGKSLPVYTYDQAGGSSSITGGFVYRGCKMPDLRGTYFFADYKKNFGRSFKWNGSNGVTDVKTHPAFVNKYVVGFGEDKDGEILVLGYDAIYRIVPAAP
jgi:glucose/arabinose dehydrogenase